MSELTSSLRKESNTLSNFRGFFLSSTILQETPGGSCFEALVMGKLVCSELDGGGPDFMGLLLALVIALVLMMTCTPRPRRFVVAPPPPVAFYRID
ncbi:hypothetical protein FH972_006025 [Carpinus fangiana]|uniref:Uncharacterized protein n=1 Tax=Carpinus fangiana TaxID=176857 RepID=A0A5N6QR09_9ROSI|nr:hypothetical protein FH972_006025 [Carpinus fangiana]